MKQGDEIYKQMVESYLETYGEKLLSENEKMKTEKIDEFAPNLHNTVFSYIQNDKKKKKIFPIKYLSVAASVIFCVLLVPAVIRHFEVEQYTNYEAVISQNISVTAGKMIPLKFTLPENYVVTNTLEDNGTSIYFLEEEKQSDEIFLSLKLENMPNEKPALFKEISLNNQSVYILGESTYNSVTFSKDGITYFLSNQKDISILLQLAEIILS